MENLITSLQIENDELRKQITVNEETIKKIHTLSFRLDQLIVYYNDDILQVTDQSDPLSVPESHRFYRQYIEFNSGLTLSLICGTRAYCTLGESFEIAIWNSGQEEGYRNDLYEGNNEYNTLGHVTIDQLQHYFNVCINNRP